MGILALRKAHPFPSSAPHLRQRHVRGRDLARAIQCTATLSSHPVISEVSSLGGHHCGDDVKLRAKVKADRDAGIEADSTKDIEHRYSMLFVLPYRGVEVLGIVVIGDGQEWNIEEMALRHLEGGL